MAKTVDSTPLIVTIAEKLGTAVGTIVAKTTDVVERHFTGDRNRIRSYAAQTALDLVRRKLM